MGKSFSLFVILVVLSSLSGPAFGQARPNDEPVQISADSEIGAANTQQLNGHVRFTQGTLSGSSDRAVHYLDQDRVELTGNVVIRQDTLLLMAPHVTWEGITHKGHADGNAMLMDRDVTLTAVTGDYDAVTQTAVFHKHVTITQGKTHITSEELTYFRPTETSIAKGNVIVKSDSGTMKADQVEYARALDEMTATGNVELQNDSLVLTSDWLYNAKPQGLLFARGRVYVRSLQDNTIVFGDTLARFAKESRMSVPVNPLLLMIDTSRVRDSTFRLVTKYDTLFIKSRTMEAWQGDSERFVARDSVRMLRDEFCAIGGTLNYRQRANLMTLTGGKRERLWNDSTEIVGDSIAMLLDQRKIRQVNAVGHAFGTSPVSELPGTNRINQLQGELMEMHITHDTVRDVLVVSNALSIYFVLSDNKANGVNRASGDSIRIDFENKTVRRVTVLSGTEGEYFPERFVKDRGKLFRLAGFDRNLALRPRRDEFAPSRAVSQPEHLKTQGADTAPSEPPGKKSKKK